MERNRGVGRACVSGGAAPSEAWLFAQALLGKPIPSPASARAEAQAKREQLEWLAQISLRHADQLRALKRAEAEADRKRDMLRWLAQISTEHEGQLRALLREEAEERDAYQRWERLTEAQNAQEEWDPDKHPRLGGPPNAGWWTSTDGSGGSEGGSSSAAAGKNGVPPAMLDLAQAWWQTNSLLQQSRRDIEELAKRIANERAQVGSGGRYAYVHTQNLAKAERDLETAKALVPQLERQLHDLERQYHASGFDDIPYATWTPGETRIGGRGIEEVGRAAALGASPAGLKPTGIEIDIALAAPAVFQLGKAALKRALTRAATKAEAAVNDFMAKLPRTNTRTSSAAYRYEIRQSGPYNYKLSGGGSTFEIDGYRGSVILEAKYVGKRSASPFVSSSSIPGDIRALILNKVRHQLTKIRTIIESGSTPFTQVEIITNSPEAKKTFEALLTELGVPGTVRVAP